jgi:HPt (histidine-containing phosphotransfer) domain-containing protein
LYDTFLRQAREMIPALIQAASGEQADMLSQAAHRLKGASAEMGATGMARICKELEELGRSNSISGAGALIDQLEAEFSRVAASLRS